MPSAHNTEVSSSAWLAAECSSALLFRSMPKVEQMLVRISSRASPVRSWGFALSSSKYTWTAFGSELTAGKNWLIQESTFLVYDVTKSPKGDSWGGVEHGPHFTAQGLPDPLPQWGGPALVLQWGPGRRGRATKAPAKLALVDFPQAPLRHLHSVPGQAHRQHFIIVSTTLALLLGQAESCLCPLPIFLLSFFFFNNSYKLFA